MKPFLSLQGSRAGLFSDLFTGESCPLRILLDKLGAAVSPIPKPRKELRPPASLLRNDFMAVRVSRILGVRICENTSMGSFGTKRISISLEIA
jgi:hypothetical protein